MNFKISLSFCIIFLLQNSFQAPIGSRNGSSNKDKKETLEATQIALESTNELIASPKLLEKIKDDLHLIRYLDSSLKDRIHRGKWIPGEILLKNIPKGERKFILQQIKESEFKPIKSITEEGENETKLVFSKAYHPVHLSKLLALRFGVDAQPLYITPEVEEGKGDEIMYRNDLSTYYWNSLNGRDCEDGCLAQYALSITIDDEEESLLNPSQNNSNYI